MGARAIGGVILMIFGLFLALYSGGNALGEERVRFIVLGIGIFLWITGSLALFFSSQSKTGRNWLGGLFVLLALLTFLLSTGEVREFLKTGMLVLSIVTIIIAFAMFLSAGVMPLPGESFPMGSPQNIPPKMPVPEKKEEPK